MNTRKSLLVLALGTLTQFAQATTNLPTPSDIDANATREAIGMAEVTMIPLLILFVFMVVLAFATQKIPGLES